MQDDITEEKNSYKERYDKKFKKLVEAKKEIIHWKNSYEMTKNALTRLTSKHNIVQKRMERSEKENILNEMGFQILDLQKENKRIGKLNEDLMAEKDILQLKIDNRAELDMKFNIYPTFGTEKKEKVQLKAQDSVMSEESTKNELKI